MFVVMKEIQSFDPCVKTIADAKNKIGRLDLLMERSSSETFTHTDRYELETMLSWEKYAFKLFKRRNLPKIVCDTIERWHSRMLSDESIILEAV